MRYIYGVGYICLFFGCMYGLFWLMSKIYPVLDWISNLFTKKEDPRIDLLLSENHQLRSERDRYLDLMLERAGYLHGESLPGEAESVEPIRRMTRQQVLEYESRKKAEKMIEDMKSQ